MKLVEKLSLVFAGFGLATLAWAAMQPAQAAPFLAGKKDICTVSCTSCSGALQESCVNGSTFTYCNIDPYNCTPTICQDAHGS